MTKYPNALNTPSTQSHIRAAESNLNSAKQAKREIEIQRKSKTKPLLALKDSVWTKSEKKANRWCSKTEIADIRAIEARKATAAGGKK
jgi:hypothetical protein